MSFSVPTSPAMSRSTKAQPVTPQRLPRQQPRSQILYRSPLTPSTSPYTPLSLRSIDSTGSSTLTTPDNIAINVKKRLNFSSVSPDGGRNLTSSKDKSLADIADNWRSRANENGIKVSFSNDDSNYQADSSSDMSISDVANDSSVLSTEQALLSAPALSNHRRHYSVPITGRPRAQSNVSMPTSRTQPFSPITTRSAGRLPQTISPLQPRRNNSSFNHSVNLMSTPPPNRALARQLKLKGSLTDPAQPRRREAFGALSISSQNVGHRNPNMSITLEPDTSLDLFDIDENDEQDYPGPELEDSFSRSLHAHNATTFGYPTFKPHQHGHQPVYSSSVTFADPFQPMGVAHGLSSGHVLGSIAESVEQHFHATRQQPIYNPFYQDRHQHPHDFFSQATRAQPQYGQSMPHAYPTPSFVPLPQASMLPFHAAPMQPKPTQERAFVAPSIRPLTPVMLSEQSAPPSDCSVCLAPRPSTLAILQPCKHPLCSGCLTSALNIVGEKDMQCAVCKQSVADFKLVIGSTKGDIGGASRADAEQTRIEAIKPSHNEKTGSDMAGKSFMDPLLSVSPGSSTTYDHENSSRSVGDLDSAFEFGLDFGELRASTPKIEHQMQDTCPSAMTGQREIVKGENYVVLRIDNVPWDITPTQIIRWLQQPVERVHVLLDGKGKTLSHAYVEVKDPAIAGAILRGEAQPVGPTGKKERGSVLGRGRRARGVTITRSGQQELMTDLFPHWRGRFAGSRPSLAGLEGDRIIGALEGGLLTENEISGLLHLIREPDSHFLKVPSLPFHSLISLLTKFPVDVDSRVFWSTGIRDALFAALQNLLPRVEKAKEQSASSGHQEEEFTMELVISLVQSALDCRAFTAHQIRSLVEFSEAHFLPLPDSDLSLLSESSDFVSRSGSSGPKTPASSQEYDNAGFYYNTNRQMLNKSQNRSHVDGSLQDLAKEFGVDAHVVQALVQRLTGMC
ncbi:hypothetical protein BYT27DRAFT_7225225 [Phlegmacium glaucopus]|nr:hypothetical protein BYT27DRAFT_7225225 [Phlegmacium glaucopus]